MHGNLKPLPYTNTPLHPTPPHPKRQTHTETPLSCILPWQLPAQEEYYGLCFLLAETLLLNIWCFRVWRRGAPEWVVMTTTSIFLWYVIMLYGAYHSPSPPNKLQISFPTHVHVCIHMWWTRHVQHQEPSNVNLLPEKKSRWQQDDNGKRPRPARAKKRTNRKTSQCPIKTSSRHSWRQAAILF